MFLYEMGRMNAKRSHKLRQEPTTKQKIGLGIGLVIFWVFLTPIFALMIYAFASLFLDWSFWLCLIVGGFVSLWLCSLFVP